MIVISISSAPVGLIVTIDRRPGIGAFIDVGSFLRGLTIAARTDDQVTCPQAAIGPRARRPAISRHFTIEASRTQGHIPPTGT